MADAPAPDDEETPVDEAAAVPGPDPASAATSPSDRMPRWLPKFVLLVIFMLLATLAVLWFASRLRDLLVMLLVSLFLSFALEPAVNFLARKGWRRGPATAVSFLGLVLVAAVFVGSMIPLVFEQASKLFKHAGEYLDAVNSVTKRFGVDIRHLNQEDLSRYLNKVSGTLQSVAGDVVGNVLGVGTAILGAVFKMLTIGLFTFYLVADGPKFRRTVLSTMPAGRQREVLRVWDIAIDKTGGYLYSRLLLATAGAVASYICFKIAGVDSPLALALWFGVISQFIPVIGTYIASVLPALVALAERPMLAVVVLVFVVVYQQLENYFLSPRITRHTMQLHPAVAFGAAIGGASILGPLGALLALPGAAIIQAFVSTYIHRHEVIASPLISHATDEHPKPRKRRRLGRRRPEPAAEEPGAPAPDAETKG